MFFYRCFSIKREVFVKIFVLLSIHISSTYHVFVTLAAEQTWVYAFGIGRNKNLDHWRSVQMRSTKLIKHANLATCDKAGHNANTKIFKPGPVMYSLHNTAYGLKNKIH